MLTEAYPELLMEMVLFGGLFNIVLLRLLKGEPARECAIKISKIAEKGSKF